MLLIKHGFREETAFGMSRAVRLAALIVIGQMRGWSWDFENMRWRERN